MAFPPLMSLEEAIKDGRFVYARFDPRFGGIVKIYHRYPESPTGVYLASSGTAQEADPLLRRLRNTSALSPTEGR